MENTCDSENCKLFDLLGGTPEQCPNYQETWWTPQINGKPGTPILIKDCAPRRIFIMIQELYNRMIGIQQAQEKQRDENIWVQVVAETIGKNIGGVDLGAFVKERQRLDRIQRLEQDLEHKKTEELEEIPEIIEPEETTN